MAEILSKSESNRVGPDNILRYVKVSLGQDRGQGVGLELSDGMIIMALRSALAEYGRYHPLESHQTFVASVGASQYTPDPPLRGIIKIDLNRQTQLGLALPELSFIGGRILGHGGVLNWKIPYEYATFIEWKTAAEQVFSQVPMYEFIKGANKIYFYSPSVPLQVYVVGAVEMDVGFDEEFDILPENEEDLAPAKAQVEKLKDAIGRIPVNHQNWIRKLTLAESMIILGRMRSKYGSIPTVDGNTMQLDGDAMKAEGKEMKDEIMEEIISTARARMVPVFG